MGGAKVFCALFMGDARWVIGWGMCGRAEFAYLIAQMALSTMLMSEEVFSICIWSLLWATLIAPLVFKKVLDMYTKKLQDDSPGLPKKQKTAACGVLGTQVLQIKVSGEKAMEAEVCNLDRDEL